MHWVEYPKTKPVCIRRVKREEKQQHELLICVSSNLLQDSVELEGSEGMTVMLAGRTQAGIVALSCLC